MIEGLDVSHHQGEVAWESLRGQGISFAIAKATEGSDFTDSRFAANWAGIGESEIPFRGAYHFLRMTSTPEAQATNFGDRIDEGGVQAGDFFALDIEKQDERSGAEIHAAAAAWVEAVRTRFPDQRLLIYSGHFWRDVIASRDDLGCPLWLPAYVQANDDGWVPDRYVPEAWPEALIWQYSSKGSLQGIGGGVDRNRCRLGEEHFGRWLGQGARRPGHGAASGSVLSRGSEGKAVEDAQRALEEAGFDPGKVDGKFGKRTEEAVRAFQEARGLNVDGRVGPETRRELGLVEGGDDDGGDGVPDAPPGKRTPVSTGPGTAYYREIDVPQGAGASWAGGRVLLANFDVYGTDLKPKHVEILDRIVAEANGSNVEDLRIERILGRASQTGGEPVNQELSLLRAEAAANHLAPIADRIGEPPRGLGSSDPIEDRIGREEPLNRSVELECYMRVAANLLPEQTPPAPAAHPNDWEIRLVASASAGEEVGVMTADGEIRRPDDPDTRWRFKYVGYGLVIGLTLPGADPQAAWTAFKVPYAATIDDFDGALCRLTVLSYGTAGVTEGAAAAFISFPMLDANSIWVGGSSVDIGASGGTSVGVCNVLDR